MAEGRKTGGRAPGTPNKATSAAREAIAQFVDGNAHRLTEWLDRVAEGVKQPMKNENGEIVLDDNGNPIEEYVVTPNPAKAFDMFQSVVEYHIPKLARQELVGDPNKPLEVDLHVTVFGELLKSVKMQRQLEAHGDDERRS
jgi:hypothetical protein